VLRVAGRYAASWLPSALYGPPGSPPGTAATPKTVGEQFLAEFKQVYPSPWPPFHNGSFSEAVRAAEQRQLPLFVYLHSDQHEDTDSFCKNTLCTVSVCTYLRENCVCWAGNIRSPEAFQLSQRVRATSFPYVALLAPTQRSGQLAGLYQHCGLISADDLVVRMFQITETFKVTMVDRRHQVNADVQARLERVRQDEEFEQALAAEQKKVQLAEEQQKEEDQAELARQQQAREEEKRLQDIEDAAKARQSRRDALRASLPAEPVAAADVAEVGVRLPSGQRIKRNFLLQSRLQVVFDFIASHEIRGLDGSELQAGAYQIVTNYPRKTYANPDDTLASLKLGSKVMFFIEELKS